MSLSTENAKYTAEQASQLAKELDLAPWLVRWALEIPDPIACRLEKGLRKLDEAQTPEEILRVMDRFGDNAHLFGEQVHYVRWAAIEKLTPLLEVRLVEAKTSEEVWELWDLAPNETGIPRQILGKYLELAQTEPQEKRIAMLNTVRIHAPEGSGTYHQALVQLMNILEGQLNQTKTFEEFRRMYVGFYLTYDICHLAPERALNLAETFDQVSWVLDKYGSKQALEKGHALAETREQYQLLLKKSVYDSELEAQLIRQLAELANWPS